MSLPNLLSNSVAEDLPSTYVKQELLCKWVLAKTWNSCSRDGKFTWNELDLLSVDTYKAVSGANVICKRRNLHMKSFAVHRIEQKSDRVPVDIVNMVPFETDTSVCPTSTDENMEKDDDGTSKASELLSVHTDKDVIPDNFSKSNPEMDEKILHSDCQEPGNDIERTSNSNAPTEALGRRKDSKILETCELCGGIGDTENMLICDNCEKGFHVSCHIPKHKPLPFDDWFCKNCMRLRNKVSLDAAFLKSRRISGDNESSRIGVDRISRMLRYPDPYTSRVRIGSTFQAEVPQFTDQNSQDLDDIDEPLELNLAEAVFSHDISKLKSSKNWLQCRRIEVVKAKGRRKCRRIACGKWRRAPFSEAQTDDWDCFCAVRWDPAHADCAVPQEEDTEKVMKDLKLIEKLKSRLSEKKEK